MTQPSSLGFLPANHSIGIDEPIEVHTDGSLNAGEAVITLTGLLGDPVSEYRVESVTRAYIEASEDEARAIHHALTVLAKSPDAEGATGLDGTSLRRIADRAARAMEILEEPA